jgi:uncharacterized protein YjlB
VPEAMMFEPSGTVPNNPRLPVLLYRAAFRPAADLAASIERIFAGNGWPPQWRHGIFSFHHYHCQGHEVLGVAAGEAEVRLGGEDGTTATVRRGDAMLLPAGTGHRCLSHSADFLVVGAYPPGQHGDIQRAAATPAMLRAIAQLPYPSNDPLGDSGGVPAFWPART